MARDRSKEIDEAVYRELERKAKSIVSDLPEVMRNYRRPQPTRYPTMEDTPTTPPKKPRAKATTKKRATRKDKGVKRDGNAEDFAILKALYGRTWTR